MAKADPYSLVRLYLNNPVFQENLLSLQKPERLAALDNLNKIHQLSWNKLHRDNGLKWEKVFSVKPPSGIDVIYSLRITQSRRATAFRDGDFIRLLTITISGGCPRIAIFTQIEANSKKLPEAYS